MVPGFKTNTGQAPHAREAGFFCATAQGVPGQAGVSEMNATHQCRQCNVNRQLNSSCRANETLSSRMVAHAPMSALQYAHLVDDNIVVVDVAPIAARAHYRAQVNSGIYFPIYQARAALDFLGALCALAVAARQRNHAVCQGVLGSACGTVQRMQPTRGRQGALLL